MNKRFTKLTDVNVGYLYDNGHMGKGTLVKYRYLNRTMMAYSLDSKNNQWNIGIISHVQAISFMRGSGVWQIKVDENGIEEHIEFVYDISVHTSEPSVPLETVSTESHEIYLANNLNKPET
jgi:hypothetical protein